MKCIPKAPSSQKDYIICGPEFGLDNIGNVSLIHRSLYRGKSAGRDFRDHLILYIRVCQIPMC